ncbi:MAG: hypothetical protein KJN76_14060, partial [Eudoraea sp.]|nr:hypothetical protein [Eudoraea sp.]
MKTRIIIISLIISFVYNPAILAHEGHRDPVLAELNDYLMAIQLMRVEDPRAAEIFKTWQELKSASWEIRRLTDDQDLLINSKNVMEQIGKTKAKQRQLLEECRLYFAELVQQQAAIHFVMDRSISAIWNSDPVEVQVQHFKVLLVEIENK